MSLSPTAPGDSIALLRVTSTGRKSMVNDGVTSATVAEIGEHVGQATPSSRPPTVARRARQITPDERSSITVRSSMASTSARTAAVSSPRTGAVWDGTPGTAPKLTGDAGTR
jgi:hypothetical protein